MADTVPALFRRIAAERVTTALKDTPVVMVNGPRQTWENGVRPHFHAPTLLARAQYSRGDRKGKWVQTPFFIRTIRV